MDKHSLLGRIFLCGTRRSCDYFLRSDFPDSDRHAPDAWRRCDNTLEKEEVKVEITTGLRSPGLQLLKFGNVLSSTRGMLVNTVWLQSHWFEALWLTMTLLFTEKPIHYGKWKLQTNGSGTWCDFKSTFRLHHLGYVESVARYHYLHNSQPFSVLSMR